MDAVELTFADVSGWRSLLGSFALAPPRHLALSSAWRLDAVLERSEG